MKFLNLGSINKNLALLVMLAVLPALAILLYSGIEQRRTSIAAAKHEVQFLTHAMAEAQAVTSKSARQILSTLALFPEIQNLNRQASSRIFREVLKHDPTYRNITLVGLDGEVLASGLASPATNLADRKHFREALKNKDFSVGEYIVTRLGTAEPAFPFAYPVLAASGQPVAVLTTVINLSLFSKIYDVSALPPKSFIAITDYEGLRLFYHPPQESNPIGGPINQDSYLVARQASQPEIFIGAGSDGLRRIFSFEQVRLTQNETPYMYVWAGIPESHILAPANAGLFRNLLLMLLASGISLLIAWLVAKNTLLAPIRQLVTETSKFAEGDVTALTPQAVSPDEIGTLTRAFHDMAASLRLSQGALQRNEASLRLLMNSLDALVYVADMQTCEILFINDYGRKIYGEVTGKLCWQALQKGQDGPCPFCTNKYLLDGQGLPKGPHVWEHQNTLNGRFFHIKDRAIKWIDERIVRFEVATDITDRKQAEEQLRHRYKMEAIGVMAGGIAHNFNNNLAIILGNIELSLRKIPADSAVIRLLNNTKVAISRSRDLVLQILTYCGEGSVKKRPVRLAAIIAETLELLRATIPASVALNTNLSPASQDLTIDGEPSQIHEALVNLCNNAVHAMQEKGCIQIALEPVDVQSHDIPSQQMLAAGRYAKLSVQDNGAGMSEEIQQRIFDPFFTTKAVNEGTGMGLSTVQGIMDEHQGWIKLNSMPGQGSTFELYFPVTASQPEQLVSNPDTTPRGHEKIIFLDDNQMLTSVWGTTLTEHGYQVTTETSSRRVLELFRTAPDHYDLLITDQTMPDLNGAELIRELHAISPGLPTILCTGHSSQVNEALAQEMGITVFLLKPLTLSELSQAIRKALDTQQSS